MTTFADIYGGPVPAALKQPTEPAPEKAKQATRWYRGEFQKELLMALARGDIAHTAVSVGLAISLFADNETGKAWPSIKKIAATLGLKTDARGGCSHISHAIATLKKAGVMEIERRLNGANLYLLRGAHPAGIQQGGPAGIQQTNSVRGTPRLTQSGDSFEEATKPTIELDGEMRSIAIESRMDDWAVEGQFKQWITGNEKKGVRLHHPKEAWRGFCKKYKREIGRDFEGNPEWCPELLTIAVGNDIPGEREAVRWFYKALKKRELMRKGKKREPVHNVVGWWRVASKGWHEDCDRQGARRARRDDD